MDDIPTIVRSHLFSSTGDVDLESPYWKGISQEVSEACDRFFEKRGIRFYYTGTFANGWRTINPPGQDGNE